MWNLINAPSLGDLCNSFWLAWPLLSFVNIYILIFFSETNGPIGTKLGSDVHCVWFLLLIWSTQKKQEVQSYQKGCVHIYGYKLFIVLLIFMRIVLMHSLWKSLSETWIMLLCNYYCFYHKRGRLKNWTILFRKGV